MIKYLISPLFKHLAVQHQRQPPQLWRNPSLSTQPTLQAPCCPPSPTSRRPPPSRPTRPSSAAQLSPTQPFHAALQLLAGPQEKQQLAQQEIMATTTTGWVRELLLEGTCLLHLIVVMLVLGLTRSLHRPPLAVRPSPLIATHGARPHCRQDAAVSPPRNPSHPSSLEILDLAAGRRRHLQGLRAW